MGRRWPALLLLPAAVALALSCWRAPSGSGSTLALTDTDARAGAVIFLRQCAVCHGEHGDAKSEAAAYLQPRPRDFTKGRFRLRSTVSGKPPTRADVERTIASGIPGTAMPAFGGTLSPVERREVTAFVFHLAGLLGRPEAKSIEIGTPPPVTAASIRRGRAVYAEQMCVSCHGADGRGDGPAAATLTNAEGLPVTPRDFTLGMFKGGSSREALYTRVTTGLDGTPMPGFADSMPDADRWAVVDYVMSLKAPR